MLNPPRPVRPIRSRQEGFVRTKLLAVAVPCVVAAATTLAIVMLGEDIPWNRVNFGTLPAWLALVASAGTFVGVWLAYRSLRANLKNRKDDEASLARLLVVMPGLKRRRTRETEGRFEITVTLDNASDKAFRSVRVVGVKIGKHVLTTTPQEVLFNLNQGLHKIEAAHAATTHWSMEFPTDERELELLPEAPVQALVQFMDGDGRWWRKINDGEPDRITKIQHSPSELDDFARAVGDRRPRLLELGWFS